MLHNLPENYYWELAEKWRNGTITSEELQQLEEWFSKNQEAPIEIPYDFAASEKEHSERILKAIRQKADIRTHVVVMKGWKRWAAAAAVLVFMAGGFWLVAGHKSTQTNSLSPLARTNDVQAPEANRAKVRLEDGKTIYLDSLNNGELALQGSIKLVKLSDGQVAYQSSNGETSRELRYNTLFNPRGSKVIDIRLSDGSHVWLNSGSSLTYPVAFVGKDRTVSIEGEAYFEVAHDASKPFIVNKGETHVQVLGTHFNVNAYSDEEDIKITLLEGSVKVSAKEKAVIIKPGEQARVAAGIKVVKDIDLDKVMAWKEGWFEFSNASLASIMKQVSRWYAIEIQYEGQPTGETFAGRINKNLPLSNVLRLLETNGVKFKLKDKVLTVQP